ncbi:MAG: hypothetical protein ACRDOC_11820 [Streptosporangiaceae bacterium]
MNSISGSADSGRTCQAPGCASPLPAGRRRFCSDLCRVRGQRSERRYESGEVGQAVIRMIRALARDLGAADLDELGTLWRVRGAAEQAAVEAIDRLRASYSWAELAAELGTSKQALSQWYKRRTTPYSGASARPPGGPLQGGADSDPGVNSTFTGQAAP